MPHEAAPVDRDARELARTQRELQRLITAPGACSSADAAAARAIGCDGERIALYRGMIALRFAREVAREFPATRALLGSARFGAEARAFAGATASASYTLDGYARAFPSHLRRALGDGTAAAELARLEREIASVRAARTRSARRSRRQPAGEPSAAPRLAPAPGARVRRFTHEVDVVLARFERGEAQRAPRRRAVRVALFRRGAGVVRLRIARREAPLIGALLRGEALEHAVALGLGAGSTPSAIGRMLERWVREELLIAV